MGEISDKEFEYFDDKKILALTNADKHKQAKAETLNQTVPVKKEDLSLLVDR